MTRPRSELWRSRAPRDVVINFVEALIANDQDAADALLDDDYIEEYPQSNERIRGKRNRRAIADSYPLPDAMEAVRR